jgi:hypothetical protein
LERHGNGFRALRHHDYPKRTNSHRSQSNAGDSASDDNKEWLMRVDGESPPAHLLRPFPTDEMKAKEAHKDAGKVRNDYPELVKSA